MNNAKRAAGEFAGSLNNISKGDNPILAKYREAREEIGRLMVAQAELESAEKALALEQINLAENRGERGQPGGISKEEAIKRRSDLNKQFALKQANRQTDAENLQLENNRQELAEIEQSLPSLLALKKKLEDDLRSATFRNDRLIPRNLKDRKADLSAAESERTRLQNEMGESFDRDFAAEIDIARKLPHSDLSVTALSQQAEKKERILQLLKEEAALKATIASLEKQLSENAPEIGTAEANLSLLTADIQALNKEAADLKLAINRAEKLNPGVQQHRKQTTETELKRLDIQTQDQLEQDRFQRDQRQQRQREVPAGDFRKHGGGDFDPGRGGASGNDIGQKVAQANGQAVGELKAFGDVLISGQENLASEISRLRSEFQREIILISRRIKNRDI